MSGNSALVLGNSVELKYDPSVPQNMEESAKMVQQAGDKQNELNNATMLSGGKKRKYRSRKRRTRYRGGNPYATPPGKIEVAPLPLGDSTSNTVENNVEMSALFAGTTEDAKFDKQVGAGGRKRRRKSSKRIRTKRLRDKGGKKSRRRTAKRGTRRRKRVTKRRQRR
jgi:hypothetical protein